MALCAKTLNNVHILSLTGLHWSIIWSLRHQRSVCAKYAWIRTSERAKVVANKMRNLDAFCGRATHVFRLLQQLYVPLCHYFILLPFSNISLFPFHLIFSLLFNLSLFSLCVSVFAKCLLLSYLLVSFRFKFSFELSLHKWLHTQQNINATKSSFYHSSPLDRATFTKHTYTYA